MLRITTLLLALVIASPLSAEPMGVTGKSWSLTLEANNGSWLLRDDAAGVSWQSNPAVQRFGTAQVRINNQARWVDLARCQVRLVGQAIEAEFRPVAEMPGAWIRVNIAAAREGKSLTLAYEASPEIQVERLRILDDALTIRADERGSIAVPVREGLLITADSGKTFAQTFDTYAYEGCHMAMLGLVKKGAGLLVTWEDPYVAPEVKSKVPASGGQTLDLSISLRKSAKSIELIPAGKADVSRLAAIYRDIAQERGWLVTWDQKIGQNPERARLIGASNFKLWSALTRKMDEQSQKEESVRVNWTFDEAAQIAEHLKNDLKLEKVLFMMGGWIHRGYDNQHPDILPSAPECGGDAKLAECSRRVMDLGYVFSLHDNYQDIYRDSPSWNEQYIMRTPDGKLTVGGKWAGGRAYLTCSPKALELAKRAQNLPAVRKLTGANSYFIDTTYAAGLQECFDAKHPLTRADDMRWKQALSDYAREVFGIFGSECGREWALPHSDFFEGFTGVSGTYYHNKELLKTVGAVPFPLFEMVYRDTIAMWGKYGYDYNQANEYVIHHISIGRPLHYHSVPSHLYWKEKVEKPQTGLYVRSDNGWAEGMHPLDVFVKNTHEILSPLHGLTAKMRMTGCEFLTADGKVRRTVFGEGAEAVRVVVNGSGESYRFRSEVGGEVELPAFGFAVESARFVAFCANRWGGVKYSTPALFTIRSVDGKAIGVSGEAKVYRGFGDGVLSINGKRFSLGREARIGPTSGG